MTEFEAPIRLGVFTATIVLMATLEIFAPRRDTVSRRRWPANLSLVVIDTLLVRLLFPLGAVGAASLAAEHRLGLLHAWPMAAPLAVMLAFVLLDLAIYVQHRAFHAVPLLWRLHRLHHSDVEFDFTTALRFHPLEILLSMVIKFAVIIALGAPVLAVMLFEIALSSSAVFNHANARLPTALDRLLRWVVVTPDMHRVHHSVYREETDSNFGFNLPWWDRLLRTYRAWPRDGHREMAIGLDAFRQPADQRIGALLVQPLQKPRAPAVS